MLVSAALFFVLRPQDPAGAALDRYASLAKAKNVEVVVETSGVKISTLLVRDVKMRTEFLSPKLSYLAVVSPSGWRELDRNGRAYDEFPVYRPTSPSSKLIDESSLFPSWIFQTDIRKSVPPGTKFKVTGRTQIDGVGVDTLHADFQDNQVHLDVSIDAKGVPKKLVVFGETPRGPFRSEWKVLSYRALSAVKDDQFSVEIPDGYAPRSLDTIYLPTSVGDNFELNGWVGANKKPFNLAARVAKGGLIAILDSVGEPSKRAAASLARLRASGLQVVALSSETTLGAAEGFDPTGKLWEKVRVTATPTFLWVDGKGKVVHMWQGFDPEQSAAFEKDVRANTR